MNKYTIGQSVLCWSGFENWYEFRYQQDIEANSVEEAKEEYMRIYDCEKCYCREDLLR